ncbi:hypothetical protein ACH6CV_14385 [Bacillota bacterium Meth-B3]
MTDEPKDADNERSKEPIVIDGVEYKDVGMIYLAPGNDFDLSIDGPAENRRLRRRGKHRVE